MGRNQKSDEEKLEKIQKDALLDLLQLKRTTSYWGVLIETGIWPIKQQIDKRKLIYYNNILNSPEERQAKQVIKECMKDETNHTFKKHIDQLLQTYELTLEDMKEKPVVEWKRMVKKKISKIVNKLAEHEQMKQKKLRNCDEVKSHLYLTQLRHYEATKAIQIKLNMNDLKGNYKNLHKGDVTCRLCGEGDETNEHLIMCRKTDHHQFQNTTVKEILQNGTTNDIRELVKFIKEVEDTKMNKHPTKEKATPAKDGESLHIHENGELAYYYKK